MKKIAALLLIIALCSCLVSCISQATYTLAKDQSDIVTIELVKITEEILDDDSDAIVDYKMEILKEVTDIEGFLTKFYLLSSFTIDILPPSELFEGEYAIKINYNDNSHDLIGYSGGMYFKDGTYMLPEISIFFSEDEFNNFVEAYITYENQFEI